MTDGRVYHVLTCEDDRKSLQIMKQYIQQFSMEMQKDVEIHDFTTVEEEIIEYRDKFDLAVLDIDLNGGNGLELARKLQERKPGIPIVFITSYEEYRSDASGILAVGLLKKPADPVKFRLLYQRCLAQLDMDRKEDMKRFLEFVISKKTYKVKMVSIISLEKIQKKVRIKADSGIYEVRDTLNRMEQELLPCFLKINQSVIVNMNEIICIEGQEVFLSTHDSFRIGRTYQKKVETAYRRYWK